MSFAITTIFVVTGVVSVIVLKKLCALFQPPEITSDAPEKYPNTFVIGPNKEDKICRSIQNLVHDNALYINYNMPVDEAALNNIRGCLRRVNHPAHYFGNGWGDGHECPERGTEINCAHNTTMKK